MSPTNKQQRGFALVETLIGVALVLSAVVILGSMASRAVDEEQRSLVHMLATQWMANEVSILRHLDLNDLQTRGYSVAGTTSGPLNLVEKKVGGLWQAGPWNLREINRIGTLNGNQWLFEITVQYDVSDASGITQAITKRASVYRQY